MKISEINDVERLLALRCEVIDEVFGHEPDTALIDANRQYYSEALTDGSHIACIATVDGTDVGCGAICLQRELPSPENPSGRSAYLMNIYVREPFRRHGYGSKIVSWLIDEAKRHDCNKIYLETTDMGRDVYAGLGFVDFDNLMILKI